MAKDMTLDDLQQTAKTYMDRIRSRQKVRYELAKSLGFSAIEAAILQNQSEDTIRRLATEKNQ